MIKFSLFVAAGLLAAASVHAAEAAPQPPVKASNPGATDKVAEKKICKNYGTTGSRLPSKRVCLTQERWDARARDDREMIEGWMANSRTNNCHPTQINGQTVCVSG